MDPSELERKLNSVGKQAFVEHFQLFHDYAAGRIPRDQAVEKLVAQGVSNEAGAAMRLGNARPIFQAGLEATALNLVLQSKRIDASVMRRAAELQRQLANAPPRR